MRRVLTLLLCLPVIAAPTALYAAGKYAGDWTMISMKLTVSIVSWGENCGPRPKSYSSSSPRTVEIVEQGGHLIFSKGGMRTDRCGSPNPRVRTVSQKRSVNSWKRVCQTEKNDPKFERGEYFLIAVNDNRLEYKAVSKFDWALKGDHCVANSKEIRVYVRSAPDEPTGGRKPKKKDTKFESPWEFEEKLSREECEGSGKVERLVVHPRRAQLGPGEKICLKAVATDENDCRLDTKVSWSAAQGGRAVEGLVSKRGCFHAGETAADAEGRYVVTARSGGKTASSEVSVVFPDLSELLAARLKPLEDELIKDSVEETGEQDAPPLATPEAPQPSPADTPGATPVPAVSPKGKEAPAAAQPTIATQGGIKEPSGGSSAWLIAIAAIVIAGLGIAVLVVLRRAARRRALARDEFDDWPDDPQVSSSGPQPEAGAVSGPVAGGGDVACPECGRIFPAGARFCPFDKAALSPVEPGPKGDASSGTASGMICPKCHRGYESDASFCPHDSERLVPYKEWRARNLAGRRRSG